ncbi:MAG: zf-TFIIB domain-containing protein, partial [Planctomycetia bacterium]
MDNEHNRVRPHGSDLDCDQLPENRGAQPAERSASPVCYHQNCPVCGRNLRIRVTLLGRLVYCQHCGGGFVASDAKSLAPGPVPPSHP